VTVHLIQFPGSSGSDFVDFLVSDSITAPPEYSGMERLSEGLALMPPTYQLFAHRKLADEFARATRDKGYRSAEAQSLSGYATMVPSQARNETIRAKLREAAGLPGPKTLLLTCFNQLYKIDHFIFTTWILVLKANPSASLWLIAFAPEAARVLSAEGLKAGLRPGQLVIGGTLPAEKHLMIKAAADVFLDTTAFVAHSTMADALHAGLPALSTPGLKISARVTLAPYPHCPTCTPASRSRPWPQGFRRGTVSYSIREHWILRLLSFSNSGVKLSAKFEFCKPYTLCLIPRAQSGSLQFLRY